MKYIVKPGGLIRGEVNVPGDKSISHRALMLGGIAEGETTISGFLDSADCLATLAALEKLGVRIERPGTGQVIVHGVGMHGLQACKEPFDMGNAGTAMRLFMGLLAPQAFNSTLVGDASLTRRPMERVAVPLRSMGAQITTHSDFPPVEIRGGASLRAIKYELPVASAQVKSALLLAGLYAEGRTKVIEPAVTRDHTERMLRAFGVEILRAKKSVALEGGQALHGTAIEVPGDFSSAAFFIVLGCLASDSGVMLRGVGINPTRTGLLDLLRKMGADIRVHKRVDSSSTSATGSRRAPSLSSSQSLEVPGIAAREPVADIEVRASRLKGIKVPESLVPLAIDELPVFFIAAACAQGETLVRGAHELRVKESDRLAVMAEGLTQLGVKLELLPDGLWIRGGTGFTGGRRLEAHGDHRAAMAFAIAAARAQEAIEINDVANVATSFPSFVAAARAVGLHITET